MSVHCGSCLICSEGKLILSQFINLNKNYDYTGFNIPLNISEYKRIGFQWRAHKDCNNTSSLISSATDCYWNVSAIITTNGTATSVDSCYRKRKGILLIQSSVYKISLADGLSISKQCKSPSYNQISYACPLSNNVSTVNSEPTSVSMLMSSSSIDMQMPTSSTPMMSCSSIDMQIPNSSTPMMSSSGIDMQMSINNTPMMSSSGIDIQMSINSTPMMSCSSIEMPMSTISSPMMSSSGGMSDVTTMHLSTTMPMMPSITPSNRTQVVTSNISSVTFSSTSIITSSESMANRSSSVTVDHTPQNIADLMCGKEGKWLPTKAGTNATISGICYNGTVSG